MDWQLGLASLVVVLAAGHVIWRGFRLLRRDSSRPSCGSCHGCSGSKADSSGRRIISLDLGGINRRGTDPEIRSTSS